MKGKVYRTISVQVFGRLRLEILSGELPHGSDLKEESISVRFGVSRGPIREAFKELTRYGLIVPRGKAGYKVSVPASGDVRSLIVDLRRKIEIFVARAVLDKLTNGDLANLQEILDRQLDACESGDLMMVRETDFEFHEAIVRKYQDNDVEDLWRSAINRMMMTYIRHRVVFDNHREHCEILKNLKNRDFDGLVKALEQNIQ